MSLYVNCRYHREFDKFMLNIMYTMNHTGIADTVIFCDSWGYEGSDIAEKIHYQRYWVIFFCNDRHLHNSHEPSRKVFYCLYLHLFVINY